MRHDYTKPHIWNVIWSRPYKNYEKHHQIFWNKIRLRANGRIADLACGSASCWSIPHPESVIDLVGYDFSSSAIEEAKKNCAWGNFYERDIEATGATDAIFDQTILCGILNYYKDLRPLLEEAFRITKVGGEVIITINVIEDFPGRIWNAHSIEETFSPYGQVTAEFERNIGWFIAIRKK